MLEILALSILTEKFGSIVEQKGYESEWYKALTVALWLGGELVGAILGAVVASANRSTPFVIYVFALGGAVVGAGVAYLAANNPPFFDRWWWVIAGLLSVVVFFAIGLLTIDESRPAFILTFGFVFIGLMFGTISYRYVLNGRRERAALFGVSILGWIVLAIGFSSSGFDFYESDLCYPAIYFSMAASLIAILWSTIDAIRSKI